jgi:hypothetical protein
MIMSVMEQMNFLEWTRRIVPISIGRSIVSRTNQNSIVLYLHLKELSNHAIHDDLAVTLGSKAVA